MYRKNTAGQFFCVQLILTATGAVGTGLTPTARKCLDGTFSAAGGTFTEDGTSGSYKCAMVQGDTNGNNCSHIVTATGCIPVCVNFVTTAADPTDSVRLGLTALPNAAANAAGGLPISIAGALDLDEMNVDIEAIEAKTTNLPAVPASTTNITAGTITTATNLTTNNDKTGYALTAGERTSIADAMFDEANGIETSWPMRKVMRILFAALGGKASGMGTATGVFRAGDDSKDRITATIDASGNRTAVTLDGT